MGWSVGFGTERSDSLVSLGRDGIPGFGFTGDYSSLDNLRYLRVSAS
jgi:hypothetical protein